RQDNRANPAASLAILHHVGESFQNHSLASAARWVWQAQDFGAHRLGHALAAAMHPDACINRTYRESPAERADHLQWLLQEESRLRSFGYDFDAQKVRQELNDLTLGNIKPQTYDAETLAETYRLQEAVLEFLSQMGAIAEVCPTSNFRIGQIDNPE